MPVTPNPRMINPNHAGVIWDPDVLLLLSGESQTGRPWPSDASMHNRTLIMRNSASLGLETPGKFGKNSYTFSSNTSIAGLFVPLDDDFHQMYLNFAKNFTIDFWANQVNLDLDNRTRIIFTSNGYIGTQNTKWQFKFVTSGGQTTMVFTCYSGKTVTSDVIPFGTTPYRNTWNHFAFVRLAGKGYRFYFNGSPVGSGQLDATTMEPKNGDNAARAGVIGADVAGANPLQNMRVDEFRILSRCDYPTSGFIPPSAPYTPYKY